MNAAGIRPGEVGQGIGLRIVGGRLLAVTARATGRPYGQGVFILRLKGGILIHESEDEVYHDKT